MTFIYDYQLLNDQLLSEGAICSIAELQGMFCGQICGGRERDAADWVTQAREFADLEHFDQTETQVQLFAFVLAESKTGLLSDDFGFQPLLPDDACALADRARELGAWCRGYLHGFGASGVSKDTKISADVAEVLRDLAKISQATQTVDDEESEEDTEKDWFELVEYMRAGVYTIYNEMNPVGGEKQEQAPNIH